MRLLFDQNISHKVLAMLPEQYQGSTSVKLEGLWDNSDREIWEFARKNNYTIVTQDSDFNDLNLLLGFPPKIIWVRCGNLITKDFANVLSNHIDEIFHFLEDNQHGCFEIVNILKH